MPREALAARLDALVRACEVDPARAAPHLQALVAAYGEPHRAYHRLEHVAHLLSELDGAGVHDPAVEWATWYHDVVYVPGRRDNEARSAARARRALGALGLDRLAPRVAELVLATRDHHAGGLDRTARLFLDADLAILGAEPAAYLAYARAVREEHRAVPALPYALGRRAFLSRMLARPAIFATDHFASRLEARARANLAAELARLEGG